MKPKEERKYKETPTTELLDFVGKEIPYKQDKERDKQNDMEEELEHREPFEAFKYKIDRMQREIRDLSEAVEKLMKHEHGEDGKPVIPI